LLETDFPGRDDLRGQLGDVRAKKIDENGSLDLQSAAGTPASVQLRVPTYGFARDTDGVNIHCLLHVVDGRLDEFEVYKVDSSKVILHADPKDLEVTILPWNGSD